MGEVGDYYRYEALWQESARAAGWVPLADVLDALREFARLGQLGGVTHVVAHLTERFAPTAPEGADERNGHE